MVSQLMAVSQKQELSLTAVDLNLSVKHVLKLAKGSFDKSIEIFPALSESQARTMADPTQVEQMLLNLFINAAHAMTIMRKKGERWGGRLEVGIKKVSVDKIFRMVHSDLAEGDYWLVSVQDSGVGMSVEEASKIFDPFYTSKEKGQGTGLGLAMVFNIITQHNGKITVDSIPGVGTSVNVYLPLLAVRQTDEIKKIDLDLLKGEGQVLIVDDEKNIRETAREILNEFGYETLTANNGVEAVAVFRKTHHELSLIILDLIMPKMSGDEAYREIIGINSKVPVLLVSGFKQDERIQSLLNDGTTEFLQKPYDMYSLLRAVKNSITKSQ